MFRPRRRGALQSVQFLLAFPLALFLFLAVIEFGFVLLVNQTVCAAAQDGVAVASRGATTAEVLAAVNHVLAMHNLNITAATTDANVVIEYSGSPSVSITAVPCTPVGPALPVSPAESRVTVCLSMRPAGGMSAWQGGTLPDLLANWGFALTGRSYLSSALAPLE